MHGSGLLCLFVVSVTAKVYSPPQAAKALDDVEKALAQITHLPHLTKAQLSDAKKVSADVEKSIAELESPAGQKLSKEARNAKVTASVKELESLQTTWSKSADVAIADRKAALEKELKDKEAELEKDTKMMKVLTLEKKLAEKKLKLQNMIDAKNAEQAKRQAAKEAAEQQAMVSTVMDLAKNMKTAKDKTVVADKLKPVMSYLESRKKTVSDSLAKIDSEEKNREAEINALTSAPSKMAVSKAPTFLAQVYQTMRRVAYSASGFNKYGLMHDDVLYETPDVEEALRRLPTQLIDERNFRITRALQYSGQKKYLAKEEWTKFDEDVRYLQPYLTEVIKERLEKEAWDRK